MDTKHKVNEAKSFRLDEGKFRNSLVSEHGGRIGPHGLQVLHGVPLVDAALLGGDAALIVARPGERNSTGKVVISPRHLARFVQHLQR